MEEDKDIHSKVANNLEDQEKEQENPSTSEANNESPSVTGNETQSPAAEACAVAQPPKDDTNESTNKNGATSSESTTAGVSTAGIALSDQVATDNSHVFNESWSKLHKDVIIDKIKGVIYGQAIGDAFGLATEFISHKEAKRYYKQGPSGYADIIPDMHRQRWKKGDWTDDTDQMLLILQMIVEKGGQVDVLDFANRLYTWMTQGFKELGDIGGMGIGATTKKVLTHPDFLKDPKACATEVWEASRRYLAANGAIMRTSIMGVLNFNDVPKVVVNTTEISKVTHADPRCTASCIAVTTAIAMILRGDHNPSKKDGLKHLVEAALKEAEKVLEDPDHKKELRDHASASLDGLKLDEGGKIGYTYKAFGAGFYALRKSNKKKFREIITKVIMQGGDADSNGAVCGALVGCVVGFKALPEDLLQFPHRTWLDQQVDNFLKTIGLS